MNISKQRVLRALVHRGMLSEADAPKFLDALNRDPETQREFLKEWRNGRAARWKSIKDLAMWFWERREIFMRIISIALLFADGQPKVEEKKVAPKRKREEKKLYKPQDSDVTEQLND